MVLTFWQLVEDMVALGWIKHKRLLERTEWLVYLSQEFLRVEGGFFKQVDVFPLFANGEVNVENLTLKTEWKRIGFGSIQYNLADGLHKVEVGIG